MALDSLRTQGVSVIDLQDRVLFDDSEEHHQADRAIDIQRAIEDQQGQQAHPDGRARVAAL